MIKHLLYILLFLAAIEQFHSQEEGGVVALNLPVRNSLKFNRHIINPTFSFVREQNKYISLTNKKQWVQFDDAPQSYLFGYSGRFKENIGGGVSLFQQNYGVLTTFGGLLNFAYNATLNRDSNLTFGLNIGAYSSGVNTGNIITNVPDAALQNVPSNFLLIASPGINYGTSFFDFGVSLNNLVSYNLKSSTLIEENPEQSVQGHIMYTGYMDSRGFFYESKFSTLIRAEVKKDETIFSALAMLTVPKGIWGQIGYNTFYGASIGVGLNVSENIALEYNYEKAIGDLSVFGNSHELTLGYKFKNRNRYNYSGDDNEESLIIPSKKSRRVLARRKTISKSKEDKEAVALKREQARIEAQAKAKAKIEERAKLKAAAKARNEARLNKEVKVVVDDSETTNVINKEDVDQTRLATEAKDKADEEARQARLVVEAKAKADEEARQVRLAAEAKAKADEEARQSRLAAEAKAKADEEARQLRLVAEAKAKTDEEARQSRLAAEAKAKADEEARQSRLAAEAKAKADEEARQSRLVAEAKAKADEEARQLRLAAEVKAKADEEARQVRLAAEAKAKADEEARQLRLTAVAKAKADEEARQARLVAEAKAKAKADEEARQARLAAEAKAKADEEARQARLAIEAKAKAEEEAKQLRLKAEAKAKKEAEIKRTIEEPTDDEAILMNRIAKSTKGSKVKQEQLFENLNIKISSKEQDLKDLKEENDLGEKGIFKAPKAFKSVSAENKELESIKLQLDEVINVRSNKVEELEKLYKQRLKIVKSTSDITNKFYKKKVQELKAEQLQASNLKKRLMVKLQQIEEATDFERKRRIKRAAYDNADARYLKDRGTLKFIKENTPNSNKSFNAKDFNNGESFSGIKIVKDVKNVESGYYVVIAIHSDENKRDEFLTKVVSAGQTDVDFFYDENTTRYYIYYKKFRTINEAQKELDAKGTKPYNSKMSLIKIEN